MADTLDQLRGWVAEGRKVHPSTGLSLQKHLRAFERNDTPQRRAARERQAKRRAQAEAPYAARAKAIRDAGHRRVIEILKGDPSFVGFHGTP